MLYTVDNDSPSSPPPSSKPTHNGTFYLDSITFQVENELFKIPVRFISSFKTEPFQSLATRSLPSGDDFTEDMSDDNPIILPDTSKVDFQRLLQVICPLDFEPEPITSVDVWHSVLKLSTKWGLLRVRTLAIKTMNTLDLSNGDLIRFGREHKVSDWLVKGYFGLATQVDPLSLADLKDVIGGLESDKGLEQIVKLAGLREKDRGEKPSSYTSPNSPPPPSRPVWTPKRSFGGKSKRDKSPSPPLECSPSPCPYSELTELKNRLDMNSVRTVFVAELDEVEMFEKYLGLEI